MKENKEKKIKNCDEISKLIKAFPKDIAALDKRSVLAKVNSQGSGRLKPSPGQVSKVGDDIEWKDVQKKDTNKRPSETRNNIQTKKKIINKISYFWWNSLNKSLNQKCKLKIRPIWRKPKIMKLLYEKWIHFQQKRLNPEKIMKKTYRIKTNNQELLIRKQYESDATSRRIDFQKTRAR